MRPEFLRWTSFFFDRWSLCRLIFPNAFIVLVFFAGEMRAQMPREEKQTISYWNSNLLINAMRLPPPPADFKPRPVDLDNDGDPDLLYSITSNSVPVLWIDDDDDLSWDDAEGDTDSDCVLVDRNKDGKYGHLGDFIVDWTDSNNDGKADIQTLVEYPETRKDDPWPNGHYMWVLDTDQDNVFNYIDWNSFQIKAWDKFGISDFFLDYSGKSTFIKIHVATYTMEDLRINWENPFLFYDPDNDGLSEMAVRLVDSPVIKRGKQDAEGYQVKEKGTIDWVSIGIDSDNDNGPGNEFDFDFTVNFRGPGFNYMDQIHAIKNMRGLAGADFLFLDPRWRRMTELVYADHDSALDLTFNKGKWDKVYFVYDEDDDCNRWERVELLDPLDPFKSGAGKGGLDNNVQADVAGDRGEWDLDNSGGGKLYVSKFDGRIHLFGAEWGAWRIDQNASLYQGWDRKFLNKEAGKLATVKYEDADKNGFLDKVLYDLDGDKVFEDSVALKNINVKDSAMVVDISKFKYQDYVKLQKQVSNDMWDRALFAVATARRYQLNLSWYAKWMKAASLSQKYTNGFWLQFYIYRDLKDLFQRKQDHEKIKRLERAYYSSDWKLL